jgi:hypothetical protein
VNGEQEKAGSNSSGPTAIGSTDSGGGFRPPELKTLGNVRDLVAGGTGSQYDADEFDNSGEV